MNGLSNSRVQISVISPQHKMEVTKIKVWLQRKEDLCNISVSVDTCSGVVSSCSLIVKVRLNDPGQTQREGTQAKGSVLD